MSRTSPNSTCGRLVVTAFLYRTWFFYGLTKPSFWSHSVHPSGRERNGGSNTAQMMKDKNDDNFERNCSLLNDSTVATISYTSSQRQCLIMSMYHPQSWESKMPRLNSFNKNECWWGSGYSHYILKAAERYTMITYTILSKKRHSHCPKDLSREPWTTGFGLFSLGVNDAIIAAFRV